MGMTEPLQLSMRKSFGTPTRPVQVLGGLTFDILERDFVSIIGPSGCGKTTVFNIIAGLIEPDEGALLYRGDNSQYSRDPGFLGIVGLHETLAVPLRLVADWPKLLSTTNWSSTYSTEPSSLLVVKR